MFELLKTAVTGVNIIPTTLLGLVILYWLTVIIGLIDIDFLDIDTDMDTPDAESFTGPFHAILAFLNMANIPTMLVLSIMILSFWTLSMLAHLLPFKTGGFISGLLFIPEIIAAVFVTKVVTIPLKNVFKDADNDNSNESEVIGKLCRLLGDISPGRLGQAEIERDGASIIINIMIEDGDMLGKGTKALVVKKDPVKDFYIIKKFEGVR